MHISVPIAVTALETGQWESQRNWKDIFATEVATRIERSYLKVQAGFNYQV